MQIQEINKLLTEFQKIPKRKRNRTFMEISGYPHYENVCSNILEFYFEPKNEHNLNDLLLKSLLQSSEVYNEHYIYEDITVKREVTTSQNNRLDLLIETDKYIIGIENKIYAKLNNDLRDYSEYIDKEAKDKDKERIKIVLSLNKINNPEIEKNGFENITYPDFFKNIQNNLGSYILTGHNEYLILLKGFITSINNLNGNNMENKELNLFFEQNMKPVSDLMSYFIEYKKGIKEKTRQLHEYVKSKYDYSHSFFWEDRCLSYNYIYKDKDDKIAVDACIGSTFSNWDIWEIQLFGRTHESSEFLFEKMCNNPEFLGKPIEEFKIEGKRLIFAEVKVEENIENVAEKFIDLLKRVEEYLKNNPTQQ